MNSRYTRWISEAGRLSAMAAAFLATVLLAGCTSSRPDPYRPDPLTGMPKRIPAEERVVSSTYAPDRYPPGAFASAGARGPEGVSNLGIREGRSAESDRAAMQPAGAWTGSEARNGNASPGVGARLGGPPAGSAPSYSPTGSGPVPGVRIRSFEEGQQFLSAHGVKWQDLQTTGEGWWRFSCTIPNRSGKGSMRTYDATERWGLVAMQKVIDQVLRDQSR